MEDLIKREDAIKAVAEWEMYSAQVDSEYASDDINEYIEDARELFKDIPAVEPTIEIDADQLAKLLREGWTIHFEPKQAWIPCSERLPDDIRPVLVTWKNTDPASYYQYIVGKHFIGTAHYYRGKWFWYSSVTEDLLAEYGKCETEEFDEAIEAVAWMPLPEPWKGADDEGVR